MRFIKDRIITDINNENTKLFNVNFVKTSTADKTGEADKTTKEFDYIVVATGLVQNLKDIGINNFDNNKIIKCYEMDKIQKDS